MRSTIKNDNLVIFGITNNKKKKKKRGKKRVLKIGFVDDIKIKKEKKTEYTKRRKTISI